MLNIISNFFFFENNIISNLVPLQLNIFVHKHELQASLNNTVGFGSAFPTQCLRFFFFFFKRPAPGALFMGHEQCTKAYEQ